LEQFSHFKLQYLVAAIILALWFLFSRRSLPALVMLVAVAVNAAYVLPWSLPGATASAAGAGEPLRLLLANVNVDNPDVDRLLDLAERESPDLMVVQEVNGRWSRGLESLRQRMPHRVMETREDPFGIALLSRWPLLEHGVETFAPGQPPSIRAAVHVRGRRFSLIASHPVPPESAARWESRNRHLEVLARTAREAEDPVILIGDLNVTMWSSRYRVLEDGTGLINVRRGFGLLPTWPLFFPPAMIPLDHCLVTEDFRTESVRTGPDIGSDHLPLIVDLRLVGRGSQ
jgi:endonuclease/exonuclease/phosphatase (EEP) superfamily protein YafD